VSLREWCPSPPSAAFFFSRGRRLALAGNPPFFQPGSESRARFFFFFFLADEAPGTNVVIVSVRPGHRRGSARKTRQFRTVPELSRNRQNSKADGGGRDYCAPPPPSCLPKPPSPPTHFPLEPVRKPLPGILWPPSFLSLRRRPPASP